MAGDRSTGRAGSLGFRLTRSDSRSASGGLVSSAKSRDLFERARAALPGGVSSPVRAFGAVGGEPVFMSHGRGPRIVDVDGNEYVDLVMSWGPLIHGHAHPVVLEAIEGAARMGSTFGAPCEAELLLAEKIMVFMP